MSPEPRIETRIVFPGSQDEVIARTTINLWQGAKEAVDAHISQLSEISEQDQPSFDETRDGPDNRPHAGVRSSGGPRSAAEVIWRWLQKKDIGFQATSEDIARWAEVNELKSDEEFSARRIGNTLAKDDELRQFITKDGGRPATWIIESKPNATGE